MFDNFRRERQVRRALRAIARQRVALVLQPGNVQVVERSPPKDEWFELGVRTAQIRGWVEVLHENLPTGTLQMNGNTPQLPSAMTPETHYKLTHPGSHHPGSGLAITHNFARPDPAVACGVTEGSQRSISYSC